MIGTRISSRLKRGRSGCKTWSRVAAEIRLHYSGRRSLTVADRLTLAPIADKIVMIIKRGPYIHVLNSPRLSSRRSAVSGHSISGIVLNKYRLQTAGELQIRFR
jgi:hypothetical protein